MSNIEMNKELKMLREKVQKPKTNYKNISYKFPLMGRQIPNLLMLDLDSSIDIHRVVESLKNENVIIALWISETEKKHLPNLLKLNLQGYLLKGMKQCELSHAFTNMLDGNHYIHPKFMPVLLQESKKISEELSNKPVGLLSKREWEVLKLIVKGSSNQRIAEQLNIADKTVKSHVRSILFKLKVPDRTNAAVLAIKNKWLYV